MLVNAIIVSNHVGLFELCVEDSKARKFGNGVPLIHHQTEAIAIS
jgi:hypothetical protein